LKDGGYFISGKFEQTQRPEPYSAFVAALTEFSRSVVSRGPNEITYFRANVDELITTEHRVLTEMVPALKLIFNSKCTGVHSTSGKADYIVGTDAVNRFKYVFRMFMRAISSKEKPIVLHLDDLHWADESSLDLYYTLLSDAPTSEGILYVGTYRTNEPSERLQNFLHRIHEEDTIKLSVIGLANFSRLELNCMISEIMRLDGSTVEPLTDLIHVRTKGNIFFVLEYLRCLYTKNRLSFDEGDNQWKWSIENELSVTYGSLQDLLISMINATAESTRNFLVFSASLGTKLDENILKHVTSGPVSVHLKIVAANGWISFDDINDCWKFSHDAIKEAAYKMMPEEDRPAFHYRTGRKLWLKLSLGDVDKYIFVVVGQLLHGIDLIAKQEERIAVAKLCLRAGERSVELSHFQNACEYLLKGILLLGSRGWRDEYELCLQLHNASAEVAFCIGDHDYVFNLVEETIKNSRDFYDTIQAHCTKLHSLGSTGQLKDAVSHGLLLLKNLGEPIPSRYKIVRLLFEMRDLKKRTKHIRDTDILQLPLIQDQSKLAIMKIVNAIILYVILLNPLQMPFLGLRIVRLSLKFGLNGMTSSSYAFYGACLAR
jgi:histidine kinase